MRGFRLLKAILVGLGGTVRGARDGYVAAGIPVPEALQKAADKTNDLEAIVSIGSGDPGLDAYDAFLDETARMGASHRVYRILADGTFHEDEQTGERLYVDVPPIAVLIEDQVLDALRPDPVP